MKSENVVYFELNNWFAGRDYPLVGNLAKWVETRKFNNDAWCKENKLCVGSGVVDMSENWCITATESWVQELCPELLSGEDYVYQIGIHYRNGNRVVDQYGNYSQFLRHPDEDGDVYGRFDHHFLDYEEENFGVTYRGED